MLRVKMIGTQTELLRPWELATLAIGIALLVVGSFYYQAPDWDIPISFIMAIMAYLTASWSQRPSICPASRWPDKAALMQPACCQPDADAVMHQNFDAVASCIGKEVGGVRVGCAKYRYNAGQGGVGSAAHVHGSGGQPNGVDADHLSTSRIQVAHSAAQPIGHWTRTVVPERCSSI